MNTTHGHEDPDRDDGSGPGGDERHDDRHDQLTGGLSGVSGLVGLGDPGAALGWMSALGAGVTRHGHSPRAVWMLLHAAYVVSLRLVTDLPPADVRRGHLLAFVLRDALGDIETVAPHATGTLPVDPPTVTGPPDVVAEVLADALLGCLRLTRRQLLDAIDTAVDHLTTSDPITPGAIDRVGGVERDEPARALPGDPHAERADTTSQASSPVGWAAGALVGDPAVLLAYVRTLPAVQGGVEWLESRR